MFLTILLGLAPASLAVAGPQDRIDFNTDIRPILSNKCFACHGPDEEQLEAGLRLDEPASATSPLDSGNTAIVAGKPEDSELLRRVTSTDEDERMPPAEFGKALSAEEIAKLTQWIREGAEFAKHWSYVKPRRPEPPGVPDAYANWPTNAIDHFTLRQMLRRDLRPSPEADRRALARRLFLDLTGLPPTVAEVQAFVANDSPTAYEELVDDLLQRPSFGEHWARKWLDLARYADSAGYADDPPRTIWAYRDWVVRAINDNMPFDQFTIEQLAADLLPRPTNNQLVATAFHRNTLTNNEGGTQDEEFRNVAVVDRVNTTMAVWMGTTMACAQCHSHKYDPITQEEYFRFFAILNNTADADKRNEAPTVPVFSADQEQRQTKLRKEIAELQTVFDNSTAAIAESQLQWEQRMRQRPEWTRLRPQTVRRNGGSAAEVREDGSVFVSAAAVKDVYTVDIPLAAGQNLAGLRLDTLPDKALPNSGSGHGGGNFVVTGVRAQLLPVAAQHPEARFVRVTNRGRNQILSLAEVQVFSGGANIAAGGQATQHSTAFAGRPELAIDGNTNGDYQKASVTHTETVTDPWWELDLGGERAVDSIAVWNRTDNGLQSRLKDFTVELLNADREKVWSHTEAKAPNPSLRYQTAVVRDIPLVGAVADHEQPDFEAKDVLSGKTGQKDGWAVGGAIGRPHWLVLAPRKPIGVDEDSILRVRIEQNSPHKSHVLGRFALSSTSDTAAIEYARLPANINAIVSKTRDNRSKQETGTLAAWYRRNVAPQLAEPRRRLAAAERELAAIKPSTTVPVLKELPQPRVTHLQFRGNYLDKGQQVTPGVPEVFHEAPTENPDRLALARWLVSDDNPLTPRVITNRYWESLFGRGIVLSSEEFGSQGDLPTHPELLDWLATELIRLDWDRKAMIRTMVMSSTYRQSSVVVGAAAAKDPDNRWLARGPRVRLTAEMVRDQALKVSGLLSSKMYGPPVRPPQPSLGLTAAFGGSTDWKTSEGDDRYRRGLYTSWRRSNPYPSMATFDAPNREVCTVRRNRTNTPLQSLVTLNDPVYVEAAQSLARIALTADGDRSDQIALAFERCTLRPPAAHELGTLVELFNDAKSQLLSSPAEAMSLATEPLGPLPAGMEAADAAAMTVVANVLLNLDEMFLKR